MVEGDFDCSGSPKSGGVASAREAVRLYPAFAGNPIDKEGRDLTFAGHIWSDPAMSKKPLVSDLGIPYFTVDRAVKSQLLERLSSFQGQKILVLGDVGLDEYVLGEVRRISPEAPVPVLEVESQDFRLGLAANVAQNVKALGATPFLLSVVGQDGAAEQMRQLFRDQGVSTDFLIVDKNRPTTRKARIMAKHHHLVRVDYESRRFVSPETEKIVLSKVRDVLPEISAIILEDYAKGLVSPSFMRDLVQLAQQAKKPIYVDPHRTNQAEFYAGVTLIKPNFDEALALSSLTYDDLRDHPSKVIEIGEALRKKAKASQAVVTRGKEGMLVFSERGAVQVPTYARQVFDVTGAGDTVIATLSIALCAGFTLEQAAVLANYAAGVVVAQVGCVPCTLDELKAYIANPAGSEA